MSITPETLRLATQLRRRLDEVNDRHTRVLVAAYARAWDDVAADLDAAVVDLVTRARDGRVTRAAVLRSERLAKALAVVTDRLQDLAATVDVTISGDLSSVVDAAAWAQRDLIATQLPTGSTAHLVVAFDRVDEAALDAIVRRSTQRVHSLTRPLSADSVRVMKRELVRGFAVGDNPRTTADRIMAGTQGRFEGGVARALTIARTETLDAHRAGAAAAMNANTDVLRGWQWQASLDRRTCPACAGMNGTEHPLDEPGPLGHQNCRCARLPVAKSWRDLGVDLPEPVSVLPDTGSWFDGLSDADQVAVLGRARLAAYRSGDFPISSWATRRSAKGWRDSYVPAPAPAPAPGRGSSARLAS